jgi:hypothetical protein
MNISYHAVKFIFTGDVIKINHHFMKSDFPTEQQQFLIANYKRVKKTAITTAFIAFFYCLFFLTSSIEPSL